jgi:RHS repeat-associated protein
MMEQVYTYDDNGNMTEIAATNTPWLSQNFTYDALNRLATASGIYGAITYTYDDVGNRSTRTVDAQTDTYTYVSGKNRLDYITGPNAASYSYDANGNITGIDTRTFVYNQNNRLIRVEEGGTPLGEYTYNGLGQRANKEVDEVTTVFVYDFNGNIVAESQPDGTIANEYLYMGSNRLARVDVGSGDLYYYSNNYLGTPLLLTDDTGKVVWDADYEPFGEAAVNAASTVVNNFRFAGQYYDEETGLHYNYHRYYDPTTGRYLTPDPIGLVGGINLYSYVLNNPINLIDPHGLEYSKLNTTPYDIDYGGPGAWSQPTRSHLSPIGPFGSICGPSGSKIATRIPDITPRACQKHDECYEKCAKNCEGYDCKEMCDIELANTNPLYGGATLMLGDKTYDQLKKEYGCDACNE